MDFMKYLATAIRKRLVNPFLGNKLSFFIFFLKIYLHILNYHPILKRQRKITKGAIVLRCVTEFRFFGLTQIKTKRLKLHTFYGV